ncbi:hypothetical protein EW146_g4134 [Bondarzewia mesenterica]|uniref:Uncharacterized protein n=1 Tax=Bondarzewia mesenterica TaxID=1095465 RepID=A0A4S4LVG6_9AGAM|nr:hypothetical protein EW146_g4134 [Bondarzewia mesenterica]
MDEQKPKIEGNPESGPSERVARANVDGPDRIDRRGAADGATTRSEGAEAIDIHQDTDFLWPSENEDEKEDEKRLANPSSNIVADFERILKKGFEYDVTFAHSQTFATTDAPNPCLNVAGLGSIGLPLNQREARSLISMCGQDNVVSHNRSPGVWEMRPEKIQFDNPAWNSWLKSKLVPTVCNALGANNVAAIDIKLTKLSIHEVGVKATTSKDARTSDSKFGTLLITKTADFAEVSAFSTSVLASYIGIKHKSAPVQSGYRLALTYNLLQSKPRPGQRPMLPELQGPKSRLRHVLISWKQIHDRWSRPQVIPCLLEHRDTDSLNVGVKGLRGADARLLSHLVPIARELHFCLYFASVTISVLGSIERGRRRLDPFSLFGMYDFRGFGGYGGYGSYDSDSDDSGDLSMEEDQDELDVERIVDLDGMPVQIPDLDFQAQDLVNGSWRKGGPDTKESEKIERSIRLVTHAYKRVVLLIWPKVHDLKVNVGDVQEYACNALKTTLSLAPTRRESKLVDKLMKTCARRPKATDDVLKAVIGAVREAADRWNDAQILLKVVKVARVDENIDLMGIEGFVSAYQAFGWEALKEFCTDVIRNDGSNLRRRGLVERLMEVANDEGNVDLGKWCQTQEAIVLQSLKMVNHREIEWIMKVARDRGGDYLQNIIMPQLHAQSLGREFWIPFLTQLHQEKDIIPQSSPGIIVEVVSQCIANAITQIPLFPTKTIKLYAYSSSTEDHPDVDPIMDLVKLCITTSAVPLCAEVLSKLKGASTIESPGRTLPPWRYYFLLATKLDEYLASNPGPDAFSATFTNFFSTAADMLLDAFQNPLPAANLLRKVLHPPSTPEHLKVLMLSLHRCGGIQILSDKLTPERYTWLGKGQLLRELVSAGKTFNAIIHACVKVVITNFVKTLPQQSVNSYSSSYPWSTPSTRVLELFQFCFEVGARSKYAPWAGFCAAIVMGFVQTVLGEKPGESVPAQQLREIGCGCAECALLRQFFLSDLQEVSFRKVQSIRTHLERQLKQSRAWGVTWGTFKYGSPHTLQVRKPASMMALVVWAQNRVKGQELLRALGDEAKQRQILGPVFDSLYTAITGTVAAVPPVVRPHVPASASAGQTRLSGVEVPMNSARELEIAKEENLEHEVGHPTMDAAADALPVDECHTSSASALTKFKSASLGPHSAGQKRPSDVRMPVREEREHKKLKQEDSTV